MTQDSAAWKRPPALYSGDLGQRAPGMLTWPRKIKRTGTLAERRRSGYITLRSNYITYRQEISTSCASGNINDAITGRTVVPMAAPSHPPTHALLDNGKRAMTLQRLNWPAREYGPYCISLRPRAVNGLQAMHDVPAARSQLPASITAAVAIHLERELEGPQGETIGLHADRATSDKR